MRPGFVVFPTPVGMNRSYLIWRIIRSIVFPTPVGMNRPFRFSDRGGLQVFPTPVGMNRRPRRHREIIKACRVPHTRGDEPVHGFWLSLFAVLCSPHPWG